MTPTTRQALIEAMAKAIEAQQAVLALLAADAEMVVAPIEAIPADAESRRRRTDAERARRYRERKAASRLGRDGRDEKRDAGRDGGRDDRDADRDERDAKRDASPSRACARSSSSEIQNAEKNKNPLTPKGGVESVTRDVKRDVTATPPAAVDANPPVRRQRTPNALVDPAAVAEPVRRVWEAYRKAVGGRVTLTQARVELMRQRMAEGWSVEDLEASLAGFATSKWHFGENDRGTRYTDLELWLRDARRIEQGLGLYDKNVKGGGTGPTGKTKPAPAPLNGIEAKFDKYFAEHPEGGWQW